MKQLKVILSALLLAVAAQAAAQEASASLDQLIREALRSNHMLAAAGYKVDEEAAKVPEIAIKRYPALTANAAYMYRFRLGQLTLPAGGLGLLPLGEASIAMPPEPVSIGFGHHNTLIAGATLYQPILQLPKIGTGVALAESSRKVAELQLTKAQLQVVNGVERLYYGLLAVRSRKLEAQRMIDAAEMRLYDAESARLAGKAVAVDIAGLNAAVADKRQALIGYATEEAGYLSDLRKLTGMDLATTTILPDPQPDDASPARLLSLDHYLRAAEAGNADILISRENVDKSRLAIRAAKQSYLPDLGLMAGYTYQDVISLLPRNNTYLGVSLSWNLQDAAANRHNVGQRRAVGMQAVESAEAVRRDVVAAVEKAYRHAQESLSLMDVARQARDYRAGLARQAGDRSDAGLCTALDLLDSQAALAHAQADYYSAAQAYRIALAELRQLTATH